MRSFLYFVTVLAVIALAAWAYRENHLTQQAMNDRRALEREIASLTTAKTIQRTEWAYLNRPDRLRELVDVNFERLRLIPISADHFGRVDEIAYPLPVIDDDGTLNAVEISGTLDDGNGDAPRPEAQP
ncbi:MAG: cell division protein FtsL [Rhodobacteraceae bacterium]|nr:cell division protein FtsL [Paracoccaceae bacterium]